MMASHLLGCSRNNELLVVLFRLPKYGLLLVSALMLL